MSFQDSKFARDRRSQTQAPDGTALGNLRHTLDVYADSLDDEMVLTATRRIYPPGPGVREMAPGFTVTGLSFGDLRALLATVDHESTELIEDQDGAPYPDVTQGSHPAAVLLRTIVDQHRPDHDDRCARCRVPAPCGTVRMIVDADAP